MRADDILLFGIGIQSPWQLVDPHLDTGTEPHELPLHVAADRGERYPYYVEKAVARFDLSGVRGLGLDETASKRGHNYVTVFINMARRSEPVIFVTPGRGKETLRAFADFLRSHSSEPGQILEVVCDTSPAFLSGVAEELPNASVTVDGFHIVQIFTRSIGAVRKWEGNEKPPVEPPALGGTEARSA